MLDGFEHCVAFPRAFEVNQVLADLHLGSAVQGNRHRLHHLFHEVHHPFVVLISHVQLHLGEFGVVEAVHTFVAEVLRELIHAVETADDEFFEVQFIGDTQVERHVEGVVMGFEGACGGTSVKGLQNRGFHFQIALFIQEVTHRID